MKNIPIRSIQPQEQKTDGFDSFKIRSLSDVLAGKDMNQDLHRHDFYFFLVVTKGEGMHAIDFNEHMITEHSIFIMRPGQVHMLQLKAGSEGFLIEFNKAFSLLSPIASNGLLRKAANRNVNKLEEKDFNALSTTLQTMLEEYRAKHVGYENVIKANLEVFLIRLLRCRQHHEQPSTKANSYQQEKLQEFMDLLESNINTTKQVAAYADLVHLSPYQLNSITKGLLGKTVAELIDDQNLLEAKRYLLATSNLVNQIAFQLGYEDVSYFIRFFKKRTGQTPDAFRKNFL